MDNNIDLELKLGNKNFYSEDLTYSLFDTVFSLLLF